MRIYDNGSNWAQGIDAFSHKGRGKPKVSVEAFIAEYKRDNTKLKERVNQSEFEGDNLSEIKKRKLSPQTSGEQVFSGRTITSGVSLSTGGGYLWIVDENGKDFPAGTSFEDIKASGQIKYLSVNDYFAKSRNRKLANTSNVLLGWLLNEDKTAYKNYSLGRGGLKKTESNLTSPESKLNKNRQIKPASHFTPSDFPTVSRPKAKEELSASRNTLPFKGQLGQEQKNSRSNSLAQAGNRSTSTSPLPSGEKSEREEELSASRNTSPFKGQLGQEQKNSRSNSLAQAGNRSTSTSPLPSGEKSEREEELSESRNTSPFKGQLGQEQKNSHSNSLKQTGNRSTSTSPMPQEKNSENKEKLSVRGNTSPFKGQLGQEQKNSHSNSLKQTGNRSPSTSPMPQEKNSENKEKLSASGNTSPFKGQLGQEQKNSRSNLLAQAGSRSTSTSPLPQENNSENKEKLSVRGNTSPFKGQLGQEQKNSRSNSLAQAGSRSPSTSPLPQENNSENKEKLSASGNTSPFKGQLGQEQKNSRSNSLAQAGSRSTSTSPLPQENNSENKEKLSASGNTSPFKGQLGQEQKNSRSNSLAQAGSRSPSTSPLPQENNSENKEKLSASGNTSPIKGQLGQEQKNSRSNSLAQAGSRSTSTSPLPQENNSENKEKLSASGNTSPIKGQLGQEQKNSRSNSLAQAGSRSTSTSPLPQENNSENKEKLSASGNTSPFKGQLGQEQKNSRSNSLAQAGSRSTSTSPLPQENNSENKEKLSASGNTSPFKGQLGQEQKNSRSNSLAQAGSRSPSTSPLPQENNSENKEKLSASGNTSPIKGQSANHKSAKQQTTETQVTTPQERENVVFKKEHVIRGFHDTDTDLTEKKVKAPEERWQASVQHETGTQEKKTKKVVHTASVGAQANVVRPEFKKLQTARLSAPKQENPYLRVNVAESLRTALEKVQVDNPEKIIDPIVKELEKTGNQYKVAEALELIKENPQFARNLFYASRNWQDSRKNIALIQDYYTRSQMGVQDVLSRAGVVRSMPVAAMMAAAIIDVSDEQSEMLNHIQGAYKRDVSKDGFDRWAKFVRQMSDCLVKECEATKGDVRAKTAGKNLIYKGCPTFYRGMPCETKIETRGVGSQAKKIITTMPIADNNLPYKIIKKDMEAGRIVNINWTDGDKSSDKGRLPIDQKNSYLLNKVLGKKTTKVRFDRRSGRTQLEVVSTPVKGEKQRSPVLAEIKHAGHDKNGALVDVTFRGLGHYNWKVGAGIMQRYPGLRLPFLAEDNDTVTPLENVTKTTGDDGYGLLLTKQNGEMYLLTPENGGHSWRVRHAHAGAEDRQACEGYLLLAMESIAQKHPATASANDLSERELVYLQRAWDHYKLDSGKQEFSDFKSFVSEKLQTLQASVSNHVDQNSMELLKSVVMIENSGRLQEQLKAIQLRSAVSLQHINDQHCESEETVYSTSVDGIQLVARMLEDQDVFPLVDSRQSKQFKSVGLSAMGVACQEAYLENMRDVLINEGMQSDSVDVYIDSQRQKMAHFTQNYQGALKAYRDLLVPLDLAEVRDGFTAQKATSEAYKQKMADLKQVLNFRAEAGEQEIVELMSQSNLNVSSVAMAKQLWANSVYPSSMTEKPEQKKRLDELMSSLSQLNRAADRLHVFSGRLSDYDATMNKLLQIEDPEYYRSQATLANAELAEITEDITRFTLSIKQNQLLDTDQRKMDLFADIRGMQWRDHQEKMIPKVMSQLTDDIKAGHPSKQMAKWGAGSGKSVFMVLLSDAGLAAIPEEERAKRNVLCFAPKVNVKQLSVPMNAHFHHQGKKVQVLDIADKSKHNPDWWKNMETLNGYHKQLMGVSPKTSSKNFSEALKNNCVCMLTHADCITMMILESELEKGILTGMNPAEHRKILNKVHSMCDFIRNSVTLGDESAAGFSPYTDTALQDVEKDVTLSLRALNSTVISDQLVHTFSSFVAASKNFIGFSATSGSVATEAVMSGEHKHEKISKKMNEDVVTTRPRLLNRLGRLEVVIAANKQDGMNKIIEKHGYNHGYAVLDTSVTEDGKELKTAKEWDHILNTSRARSGEKEPFALQWIDSEGHAMLHDGLSSGTYKQSTSRNFGSELQAADENFDISRRDGVLTRGQGVGSDLGALTQDLGTHAVMVGVLGNKEYGSFDSLEQWNARANRANREPFSVQKESLVITQDEMNAVKEENPELWESCEEAQKNVSAKEDLLNKLIASKDGGDKETLLRIKNESLSIDPDSVSMQEVDFKVAYLDAVRKKIEKLYGKWVHVFGETVAREVADFHMAKEKSQLLLKLALLNETANRSATQFYKDNEYAVFTGNKEGQLKQLYSEEHRWLNNHAKQFHKEQHKQLVDDVLRKTGVDVSAKDRIDVELDFREREEKVNELLVQLSQTHGDASILELKGQPINAILAGTRGTIKPSEQKRLIAMLEKLEESRLELMNMDDALSFCDRLRTKLDENFLDVVNSTPRTVAKPEDFNRSLLECVKSSPMIGALRDNIRQKKETCTPVKISPRAEAVLQERRSVLTKALLERTQNMRGDLANVRATCTSASTRSGRKDYNCPKNLFHEQESLLTHFENKLFTGYVSDTELLEMSNKLNDVLKSSLNEMSKATYQLTDNFISHSAKTAGGMSDICESLYVLLGGYKGSGRLVVNKKHDRAHAATISGVNGPAFMVKPVSGRGMATAGHVGVVLLDKNAKPDYLHELSVCEDSLKAAKLASEVATEREIELNGKMIPQWFDQLEKELVVEDYNYHLIDQAEQADRLIVEQNRLRLEPDEVLEVNVNE